MRTRHLTDPGRTEALTDGVFAIAITLLVIEIAVPIVEDARGSDLIKALEDLWPSFLAYLLGFLAIGIWWLGHHARATALRYVDHTFQVLNIVFLAGIAFVPFTSAFLAEYMGRDEVLQRIAVVVFAGWQLLTSFVFNGSWWYAGSRPELLRPDVDRPGFIRSVRVTTAGAVGTWVAVIGVALLNSTLAVVFIFITALGWLIWAGTQLSPSAAAVPEAEDVGSQDESDRG